MPTVLHNKKTRACQARPRSRCARRNDEAGFTIIEVLIAAVVLVVGVMSLFALLDDSVKAAGATRARETATSLARGIVEDAHTISYAQLSPTAVESQLQAMTGLADASGASGWQIVRNGVTYTVTASECSIDDPKDGYGVHDTTFCADSSTAYSGVGTLDNQPADLKRVTVEVKWTAKGRTPVVRQVATFTAAGEATGLSVSNLQLVSPSPAVPTPTAPVVEGAYTELAFNVTAPSSATRVEWSVDGSRQSTAATLEPKSETLWRFSWPISGLSDGAYQITAQAVNATGVVGPPLSITVTLIRGAPVAPKGIVAGYNTVYVKNEPTVVVELEWQANSERNVLGYRVYKPLASAPFKELTCPSSLSELSLSRSCIDFKPPEATAKNLTYEIAALYRKSTGAPRYELSETVSEGPPGSVTVIGGKPLPEGPNAPPKLEAKKNADGSVTLTWEAPKSGPAVSFYRVYRGSKNYTSRFAITGSASATTFTDTEASTTHEYWVTAVGEHLTESAFTGPVTG